MTASRPSTEHLAPVPLVEAISSANLDGPLLFLNREQTWLSFNEQVLNEALDERIPLLERV